MSFGVGDGVVAIVYGGTADAFQASVGGGGTGYAGKFFGNVLVNGQFTSTTAASAFSASIVNTNATATSALTVNQGSSALPNSNYASAATISAGSKFGVIGTATSPSGGAGVYGATDNLSSNNIFYAYGAGV